MNLALRALLEAMRMQVTQGPLNIYSLGGLIFLDGLRGVTTIFLMVVGAFRMMDPSLEEAARVSKASAASTFFRVTLPVLLPAVLTAAMYEFVSSMESFEAPLAVGLPAGIFVLSTLIYFTVRLQAPVDYGLGAVFGVTYMVMLLFLLWGYRRAVQHSERYTTVTGKGYHPRVISLGRWGYVALTMFVVYFFLTVLAPFTILLWTTLVPSYRPSAEVATTATPAAAPARTLDAPVADRPAPTLHVAPLDPAARLRKIANPRPIPPSFGTSARRPPTSPHNR
jgi:iron(III) transport system permease protein